MSLREIYLIVFLLYLGKYTIFSFTIALSSNKTRTKKCINNIDSEMF